MRSRQQLRRQQTNASTLRQHEHNYVSEQGSTPLLLCSFSSHCIYVLYTSMIHLSTSNDCTILFQNMICGEVTLASSYPDSRQGAIHTLTGSPPGAEAISPPFLHLYHFPLSFSGPLLLPNLCTKSLCLFLATLEPILSPPVYIVRQRRSDEFGYTGSNYSLLQVTNLQFCYQLLDWSPIRSVLYVHNSKRMLLEVCFYCFRNSRDDIIPP
jgi:hypothetical protein